MTINESRALQWFEKKGRACMFGKGDPSLRLVQRLLFRGWLKTDGAEINRKGFGLTYYTLSDEGRRVLDIRLNQGSALR